MYFTDTPIIAIRYLLSGGYFHARKQEEANKRLWNSICHSR